MATMKSSGCGHLHKLLVGSHGDEINKQAGRAGSRAGVTFLQRRNGGKVRRLWLEIPGTFVSCFTGFSGARAEEVAGLPGSWDSSHATALESSWSCRQHQEAPRLIKLSLDGIIHLVSWYATSGKWTFLYFSPRKSNITDVNRLASFLLVFLSWYGLNSNNFRNTFFK